MGRTLTEDDRRSGRLKDATADEYVKVVHTLVMCYRRPDLGSTSNEVDISFVAVQSILTGILIMSKVSATGCPTFLMIIRKGLGLIFLGICCLAMKMNLFYQANCNPK